MRNNEINTKKLSDQLFNRMIAVSVFGMIVCMISLASLTWAWFSDEINNAYVMSSANYYLNIKIVNSQGDVVEEGNAELTVKALQADTYTVYLSGNGTATLNGGYAYIDLGRVLNPGNKTAEFKRVNKTETIHTGEEFFFTLKIVEATDLEFCQIWGDNSIINAFGLESEVGLIERGDFVEELPPPPPKEKATTTDVKNSDKTSTQSDSNTSFESSTDTSSDENSTMQTVKEESKSTQDDLEASIEEETSISEENFDSRSGETSFYESESESYLQYLEDTESTDVESESDTQEMGIDNTSEEVRHDAFSESESSETQTESLDDTSELTTDETIEEESESVLESGEDTSTASSEQVE